MEELLRLLNSIRELMEENETRRAIHENDDVRRLLEELLIDAWGLVGRPLIAVEAIRLDKSSIAALASATASHLTATPVTLMKCRETTGTGNTCDKGLELEIRGGELRLKCPAHGSWKIATATKTRP